MTSLTRNWPGAAAGLPARTSRSAERRPTRVRFDLVSDLAGLAALGPDWSALFDGAGAPHQVFQTFDWLAIWAEHYVGPNVRLSIVTGRIGDRLVLVWPLIIETVLGLRVLACMGEPLAQYGDALMTPDLDAADQDAAFDVLLNLPVDVIALRHIRADAAVAPLLRRRLGASVRSEQAPYVDFTGVRDATAFESRFPAKVRSNRRRRRRRLEEHGHVTFTSYGPSSASAHHVADAFAFKRAWARRHRVFSPALRDPRFEQVLLAAMRERAEVCDLRVAVLRCAEETVGVAVSLACKGHLFGHLLASDGRLERLGLGSVLADHTLVGALNDGAASFDMLAPADAYKMDWTGRSIAVADYAAGRTLFGSLYARVWIGWGREAAKRIAARASRFNARPKR